MPEKINSYTVLNIVFCVFVIAFYRPISYIEMQHKPTGLNGPSNQ